LKTKIQFFTLLFCLGFHLQLNAQRHKIEDVLSVEVQASGPLLNKDRVEGYYIFYSSDKAKKGDKDFVVRILDTELNKVWEHKITLNKSANLLNGISNGRSLAFRFFVPTEKKIITKIFDFEGNQLSSKTKELKKSFEYIHVDIGGHPSFREQGLTSIPGFGYMQTIPFNNKKLGYSANYIPDNKLQNSFSIQSNPDKVQFLNNLCTAGDIVVNLVTSKKSILLTKDIEYYFQGVDLKTGKQIFNTNLNNLDFNANILNGEASPDGEKINLYGLLYSKKKSKNSAPIGLIKYVLNKKGEVQNIFTFDWKGKKLKLKNGKDAGDFIIHEFVTGKNGHTYAIAEQVNMNVNGSLNGSDAGGLTFKTGHLIIMELDKDFQVQHIEVIEKAENKNTLQKIGYASINQVAAVAKNRGILGYSFYQYTDEGFMIGYLNQSNSGGLKRKYIFGGVFNIDNTYSHDKIELTRKGAKTSVLRAKPGYIVLMDYYKKEKYLDMRLEKLNF